jgi:hypothetical protein
VIRASLLCLISAALASTQTPAPRQIRASIEAVQKALDKRLERLYGVEDPYAELGVLRGVYLESYGAVFSAEVNLIQGPAITPFRLTITKEDVARVHQKKSQRLGDFRDKMRGLLIDAGASLDPVPLNERVALGVTLFYSNWEDSSGLPGQIVMSATRKALQDLKLGRGDQQAIVVREY